MSQASKENKRLKAALREIADKSFRQHLNWMHFHELAMSEPFVAESEAQAFAARVAGIAYDSLGEGD